MNRKYLRISFSFILAMILLFSMNSVVFAANMPDIGKTCSITVNMRETGTGNTVSGGDLSIYRVGKVHVENGFKYVYTDSFARFGYTINDIISGNNIYELSSYIRNNNIQGNTKEIDSAGKVVFSGLESGLYFLVQTKNAPGYNNVKPFLVTLPMKSDRDNIWLYDVDASPKVEVEKLPQQTFYPDDPGHMTPTETPDSPGNLTPTKKPKVTKKPKATKKPSKNEQDDNEKPDKDRPDKDKTNKPQKPAEKLPQTGQLNWPVPILAVSGIGFIIVGWRIRFRERIHKDA